MDIQTKIVIDKKVKLKNPILITGLPGIGLIGRITAQYIVNKLKGKKIGELVSPHFPPNVIMLKDGTMKILNNELYLVNLKDKDIVFLMGDIQAIDNYGQYEVALKVLDLCKNLKIKKIITVGGYATGKISKRRTVYGLVNNKELIHELKEYNIVFGKAKGSIVGIAGLLPALAMYHKIDGICLLGTTHGNFVDPKSSEKIVEILSKYLGFKICLKDLKKQAKIEEEVIKKVEEEINKKNVEMKNKSLSYIR